MTSLYDIDRVEAARGSQRFLFGRNSIAGAIGTHTRRPEFGQREGYFELDVGQRNHAVLKGAVSMDLSENLAARVALYSSREDGYVKDVFDPTNDDLIAHNKQAARLSLRHRQGNTDTNAFVEFEDREQSGTICRAIDQGEVWENLHDPFGVALRGGDQDSDSDLADGEADNAKILSIGLSIEHDLGWATLRVCAAGIRGCHKTAGAVLHARAQRDAPEGRGFELVGRSPRQSTALPSENGPTLMSALGAVRGSSLRQDASGNNVPK